MSFIKKFIGDRAFYKMCLAIVVPMVIQNLITNFVSLLDNIMVGQVGTAQMSGVAIANQLIFVFNLTLFGALSGVGIFTAQYFGSKDLNGVRASIRLKIAVATILLGVFLIVAVFWGRELIALFLTSGDDAAEVELTLNEGMKYLRIMLVGLVPFAANQVYVSSLRESGEAKLPMKAGVAAVFTNLIGNYIFIFGHLGITAMGVQGAALATVMSRFLETFIVIFVSHRHTERFPFVAGLYGKVTMPKGLIRKTIFKGSPLMVNELLWSAGISAITQSYSTRGLSAVAAVNISSTVINMFNTFFVSFGTVISILVGQALGSGDMKEARDRDNKIFGFCFMVTLVTGAAAALLAPLFPQLYNTTEEVRSLATSLLRISSLCMPIGCLIHCSYFTLRSGGKTIVTFLFDAVFVTFFAYPVSFILSRYTDMSLVPLFLTMSLLDAIKLVIGLILVAKGSWMQNLVKQEKS